MPIAAINRKQYTALPVFVEFCNTCFLFLLLSLKRTTIRDARRRMRPNRGLRSPVQYPKAQKRYKSNVEKGIQALNYKLLHLDILPHSNTSVASVLFMNFGHLYTIRVFSCDTVTVFSKVGYKQCWVIQRQITYHPF